MLSLWLKFQGSAAELFSKLMQFLPGSDLLKLLVISALSGVLLIWLYRFVSFQGKLALLKRRIATVALEPFVFSDSARISILTPVRLLGLSARYMLLSLPPLLVLAIPVIWLLGILNQVVGYQGLAPGQQMIVSILAQSPRNIRQLEVSLEGTALELSPLVRSYQESQAWIGLSSKNDLQSQTAVLNVKVGDSTALIPVYGLPVIPVLTSSFWGRLLFPGGSVQLPEGLKEISIDYPPRYFEMIGASMSWVIVFLIVSMISGLIFARFFNIQV